MYVCTYVSQGSVKAKPYLREPPFSVLLTQNLIHTYIHSQASTVELLQVFTVVIFIRCIKLLAIDISIRGYNYI